MNKINSECNKIEDDNHDNMIEENNHDNMIEEDNQDNSVHQNNSIHLNNNAYPNNSIHQNSRCIKTVIVTVGLPARGKTFIARRLARYFNWIGVRTEVYNVGNYRRKMYPDHADASFFDIENEEGKSRRLKCALQALSDLCNWLNTKGDVAIFDATNTTRERRDMIIQKCVTNYKFDILFVESICDDNKVINKNVQSVKLCSPDYENVPEDKAAKDFAARIEKYKKQYQSIDETLDKDMAFIKIIDVGQRFMVNKISGIIPARAVYFLMNIHVMPRSIFISRNAETIGDSLYQLGGDSTLTSRGHEYVDKLSEYILKQNIPDLVIWTSEMDSATKTVEKMDNIFIEKWRALNELDAGLCQSLSYKEMAVKYSTDLLKRDKDKFYFRYPMGESYEDLVFRIEPVIMEMERAENTCVVAHHAVIRCILGYFLNLSSEEIPYINVPLHSLIKLTPSAYGCEIETINFGVQAVDTHRNKPRNCSPSRTINEALETTPGFIADIHDTWRVRRASEQSILDNTSIFKTA